MSVRVVVVDDNELLRAGPLVTVLTSDPDVEVVGQAADGPAGVRACREHTPDLVLMDIEMPGGDGHSATRRIVTERPEVRVLILTMFDLDDYVVEALRAGVAGFLLKTTPPRALIRAVHRCVAGETTMGPTVMARLVDSYVGHQEPPPPGVAELTDRERDVLRCLADGRSNGRSPASGSWPRPRSRRTLRGSWPSSASATGCRPSSSRTAAAWRAGDHRAERNRRTDGGTTAGMRGSGHRAVGGRPGRRDDRREGTMRHGLGLAGLLVTILMLFLSALAAPLASAADPPTLDINPQTVTMAPGTTATALLVLRNPGPDPVSGTLEFGDVSGLSLQEPVPALPDPIGPGASISVRLVVVADRTFAGGALPVQVIGSAGAVPFVATALLTVTVPPPLPALQVTLIGVPASMSDGQGGTVTVQVLNPTTRYLSGVELRPVGSESLCWLSSTDGVCGSGETVARTLGGVEPGGLLTTTVELRSGERVRLGSQQIAVVAAGEVAGEPTVTTVGSATASVTLTVFGIDLLSPFGIAGLLLIPGAVALLAYQATRRLLPGTPAPAAVDIKDPGALLFIVPVGLLVYLLALSVLRLNLRDQVGTGDAVWLFVAGLGIGVVVAMIWWARWWWVVGRKTFRTKDDPATVLLRIGRRDRLLRRSPASVDTVRRYVLNDGDRRMACQPIVCAFPSGADNDFINAVDADDFDAITSRIRLRRWEVWKAKPVIVSWVDRGIPGVVELAASDVAGSGPTESILMLAPGLSEMAAPQGGHPTSGSSPTQVGGPST